MISIGYTFYKTLDLGHLERSLFSLAKNDLSPVSEVVILDNDTGFSEEEIWSVIPPLPNVRLICDKHGIDDRRHSWSANTVIKMLKEDTFFFTRADYILDESAVRKMLDRFDEGFDFVSSWCWQMAYDREASNYPGDINYEVYNWRENAQNLLRHPHGFNFFETDLDAGTFLTTKDAMDRGGWLHEGLVSFGYQQSTLQRNMLGSGVTFSVVEELLFFHQHHSADRNFEQANEEYKSIYGG